MMLVYTIWSQTLLSEYCNEHRIMRLTETGKSPGKNFEKVMSRYKKYSKEKGENKHLRHQVSDNMST